MLAQNFKSAAELEIREDWKAALVKTLVLLETGRLMHVKQGSLNRDNDGLFSGNFNMVNWRAAHPCGTCACIGGTAELVGKVDFYEEHYRLPNSLYVLFYPPIDDTKWGDITPVQAARALRSYLTTGFARWDQALDEGNGG